MAPLFEHHAEARVFKVKSRIPIWNGEYVACSHLHSNITKRFRLVHGLYQQPPPYSLEKEGAPGVTRVVRGQAVQPQINSWHTVLLFTLPPQCKPSLCAL